MTPEVLCRINSSFHFFSVVVILSCQAYDSYLVTGMPTYIPLHTYSRYCQRNYIFKKDLILLLLKIKKVSLDLYVRQNKTMMSINNIHYLALICSFQTHFGYSLHSNTCS